MSMAFRAEKVFSFAQYNIALFTDTNSAICKMIVAVREARTAEDPLVKEENYSTIPPVSFMHYIVLMETHLQGDYSFL